jgi:hypothetical protein
MSQAAYNPFVQREQVIQYKPVVQYRGPALRFGSTAYVYALNHPRRPYEPHQIRTSRIVSFDEETGEFETLNTLYKRVPFEVGVMLPPETEEE